MWRRFSKYEWMKKKPKLEAYKQRPNHLSESLMDNQTKLKAIYTDSPDVIFRSFQIGKNREALLIYIDGLSDVSEIDENILAPLMQLFDTEDQTLFDSIRQRITVSNINEVRTYTDCIQEIASGNPVILCDQMETGFALGLSKWEKRAIEAPEAENVVRGPREGFIETLSVNTSMIRRRIRSPKLKMPFVRTGKYTETKIIIAYIDGLADDTLITEIRKRIDRVDVDGIIDSGVLEEFIEDNPYSPFPQTLATERPDVVTAGLLEGRAAILVDGSPFALIAPSTFFSFLQSNEDYYSRFMIGTVIRWLRYMFLVMSLLLPSLYVAILTYHQEMLPTSLLISIAASREQVPFPALIEALMMEITFEALREAGIRLPKQLGSAVSIVGALVIGDAAVSAGIVSAPMVMVVAITGVASFTIPRYFVANSIRMLKFPIIFLAGTLGLLGIMLGILAIVVHLATLRSFGVPYLSPAAPAESSGLKDVLYRAPWWKMNQRPRLTGKYNKYRQADNQKPSPIRGKD